MEPVKMTARITTLNEEVDAIHHANSLCWKQGQSVNPRPLPQKPNINSGRIG